MSDYVFYYWSVPFRGQFVRAVLAYAGNIWTEGGDVAISNFMGGPLKRMPVPFMGPPLLIDKKDDFSIAEMPAIIFYLGETLDLLPKTAALRAMTMKVVNDANDVIDDITLDGGREMWTEKRWQAFVPRLEKWMAIWEETGPGEITYHLPWQTWPHIRTGAAENDIWLDVVRDRGRALLTVRINRELLWQGAVDFYPDQQGLYQVTFDAPVTTAFRTLEWFAGP